MSTIAISTKTSRSWVRIISILVFIWLADEQFEQKNEKNSNFGVSVSCGTFNDAVPFWPRGQRSRSSTQNGLSLRMENHGKVKFGENVRCGTCNWWCMDLSPFDFKD